MSVLTWIWTNIILKYKIYSALIILIIGLLLYSHIQTNKVKNLQEKVNYITYKDSTEKSLTKSGDTVFTTYAQPIQYIKDTRTIDSLIKEVKIVKHKILDLQSVQTTTDITNVVGKIEGDKDSVLDTRVYNYDDRYLSYKALANKTLTFTKFELKDTLYGVVHKEGDELKFSTVNSNKYVHIDNQSLITYKLPITPKKKKWSISLQGGYGIIIGTTIQPKPYIGIGISRNLISF